MGIGRDEVLKSKFPTECDPDHPVAIMPRSVYEKMVSGAAAKDAEIARLKGILKSVPKDTCVAWNLDGNKCSAIWNGRKIISIRWELDSDTSYSLNPNCLVWKYEDTGPIPTCIKWKPKEGPR